METRVVHLNSNDIDWLSTGTIQITLLQTDIWTGIPGITATLNSPAVNIIAVQNGTLGNFISFNQTGDGIQLDQKQVVYF